MTRRLGWFGVLALGAAFTWGDVAWAQPSRQMPGSRYPVGTSPPVNFPPANTRIKPSANQVGFASADFYAKNGYPKVLGDAVEQTSGSTSAAGAAGGGGGAAGNVNGGGFQGNAGNQIGQNQGGTIFGGVFGGGGGGGGGAALNFPRPGEGFTGGGFTGVVPKGFGFGGTPDFTKSSLNPLSGGTNR